MWTGLRKPARVPIRSSSIPIHDSRKVHAPPPPERPKFVNPFYRSMEWRRLLARIIRARGRQCEDPQCRNPAVAKDDRIYGDHVLELRDRPDLALEETNILLRCASCHTLKTNAVARARNGGKPPPPETLVKSQSKSVTNPDKQNFIIV